MRVDGEAVIACMREGASLAFVEAVMHTGEGPLVIVHKQPGAASRWTKRLGRLDVRTSVYGSTVRTRGLLHDTTVLVQWDLVKDECSARALLQAEQSCQVWIECGHACYRISDLMQLPPSDPRSFDWSSSSTESP